MAWGAVIGGGAALAGGIMGSRSAGKAQDAQNRANAEALAEQRRQFDLNFARQEPYHLAGVGAVNELRNMRFTGPTAESVLNDPGYAFGLKEGREALENSAAARGGLFSGNAARNLLKYGTDYGTTKFNDAFERDRSTFNTNSGNLFNLANIGTGAAAQLQNSGANFANNVGDIAQRGADAAGGAAVARGNIWSDAINQGVSIGNRNNWWQQPSGGGGGGAGGFDYTPYADGSSPGGAGFGYADGGPVLLVETEPGRFEPKVGSRSARRGGGTGGGMSRENVARSLTAPPAAAKKTGMAALPVNPVTNPGGLRKVQMEEAERYNDGGPVMEVRDGRMVPKVGTRSPRPGARGTGGGMSREQVLAALTAAQAASAPAPARTGMAALPVNPVTNPGGLRKVQMEEAEGYRDGGPVGKGKKKAKCYAGGGGVRKNYMGGGKVAGPGGPRADKVPAWLSNGEHVVETDVVDAIGGGDNLRGQQVLNEVRALLRGG